jgi:hypothetical protein
MAEIKESFIKCPKCSTRFPSPIFFGDTISFETATTWGNTAQCPKCGDMVKCNKENMSYTLADDSGGGVGGGFGA